MYMPQDEKPSTAFFLKLEKQVGKWLRGLEIYTMYIYVIQN